MNKSNKINTNDLRKAAQAVFIALEEPVAKDISTKLSMSADEINFLRTDRNMIRKELEQLKLVGDTTTNNARAFAIDTLPLLLDEGGEDPEQITVLIVSLANEVDRLKLVAKRNLCPNWDSDEGECAD